MPTPGSPSSPSPPSRQRQFWLGLRRGFRWCRILALLVALALAGFLFYWHQTGLPGFVKNALLEALRHHGLELQFQSLRFQWDGGLVAQNVVFGRDQFVAGPRLHAAEVQIVLDAASALRGRLQVNLLRMRDGCVIWRFANGPHATPPLEVSCMQTELLIHEDSWELRQFNGKFFGAEFRVHGVISNAMAFARQWADAQTSPVSGPSPTARAHLVLRNLAHALTNYHFQGPRSAELAFYLDAMHWDNARADLRLQADHLATPWGEGEQVTLHALRVSAPSKPSFSTIHLELSAAWLSNRWARLEQTRIHAQMPMAPHAGWHTNLELHLQAGKVEGNNLFTATDVEAVLQLSPAQTNLIWRSRLLHSPWLQTGPLQLHASSPTNFAQPFPLWSFNAEFDSLQIAEQLRLQTGSLQTTIAFTPAWPPSVPYLHGRGRARDWQVGLQATGALASLAWNATLASNAWTSLTNSHLPLWQRAAPVDMQWHLELTSARLDHIEMDSLDSAGSWSASTLNVTHLEARRNHGTLKLNGSYHPESRKLQTAVSWSGKELPGVAYLPQVWQAEIQTWQWENPPKLEASIAVTFPTNLTSSTNWLSELAPHAKGYARLQLDHAQRRQQAFSHLVAEAEWDGHRLSLPHVLIQAETNELRASLALQSKGDFYAQLAWHGNPNSWLPYLPTNVLKHTALWEWRQPLALQLHANGRWRDPFSWQAQGELFATNFSFRQVAIESLHTRFTYASNVVAFLEPRIRRSEGEATARRVEADLNCQMIFLRDARGAVDPMAVAQIIGPHVVKTLAPYRFGGPVQAQVSGAIPMHGELGARVQFHLTGTPFAWWRFHASNVTATIVWHDEAVLITNLWADFYGGRLGGDLHLDFSSHLDTAMHLRFNLSQAQFAGMMADISDHTNHVEGLLSGHLNATARASDWKSWNGFGSVELNDGLIWNIPIFGLFSPVLNAISPGLGNSRAREARGTFTIRDSVIHTDDLVIQAAGYNLKYRGAVNFDYELDARVEAELLRETKVLGPALSLFFKPFTKLFEYRLTGTLSAPKTKPVYIPSLLMKLLTPVKSLRELFQSDAPPPTTKLPASPPAADPKP